MGTRPAESHPLRIIQPYKFSNNQNPVVHAISVPTSQLKAQYLDYDHHPVVHAMCRDFPKMTPQYLDQVVHGATQPYKSSNNQNPLVHAISIATSQPNAPIPGV
ncbi:unnamed protein product [Ambrosiozyma monospora]|uniref:Unnamed protein product n=1 Tax=Ambrosiozyma monospora TaxID=43982 RepID=A0A9W6T5L9_AMBMO|nr:unnamed protein product [Ambrosiozyma monospora]